MTCNCVSEHRPTPSTFERHHILPLAWGGSDDPDNVVSLCPTTHSDTHKLLREYRRLMEAPPWEFRRHYGYTARRLAFNAWQAWTAEHGDEKPPRTFQHPDK